MRRTNDFYPTTDAPLLIPPLMNALNRLELIHQRQTFLEPCAGKRDMYNAIRAFNPKFMIESSDIDYEMDEASFESLTYDATHLDYWDRVTNLFDIDWAITNPPFNQAIEILNLAYSSSNIGVAMLLRWSFLEPTQDRTEWLKNHERNLILQIPFSPRPQFRKGEINPDTGKEYGTDSVTTAWLVWIKDEYLESIPSNHSVYQPCSDWNPEAKRKNKHKQLTLIN